MLKLTDLQKTFNPGTVNAKPALDPKTAAKVLELTDKIVTENKLTTLMITHNMRDAITHGNRLSMMHEVRVIIDVEGDVPRNILQNPPKCATIYPYSTLEVMQ